VGLVLANPNPDNQLTTGADALPTSWNLANPIQFETSIALVPFLPVLAVGIKETLLLARHLNSRA